MIENKFVPYISTGSRGLSPTVPLHEIINAIIYKLKTGLQWYLLPVKVFLKKSVKMAVSTIITVNGASGNLGKNAGRSFWKGTELNSTFQTSTLNLE